MCRATSGPTWKILRMTIPSRYTLKSAHVHPVAIHGPNAHVEPDKAVIYVTALQRPIFSAPTIEPVVHNIARYPPPLPTHAITGTFLPSNDLPNNFSNATFTFGARLLRNAASSGCKLLPTRTVATASLYGLLIIAFSCDLRAFTTTGDTISRPTNAFVCS